MSIYMFRNPRTFTISWEEKEDMSSGRVYSDDAAWLTAWSPIFDNFFWYEAVLLDNDWNEISNLTQKWWVFSDTISSLWNITDWYNVMIKFPLRWIKMTKNWRIVTLSITEELNKEWYQYYAHSTWSLSNPWNPKNAFYLWIYEWYNSNDVLKSWSWKTPTDQQTIVTFCTQAKANGNWYNIIWFYQRQYINALYMMKYWNPDSSSVIWWWASTTVTWRWNNIKLASYCLWSNVKLFWLEDVRWNVYEWIWWVYNNWQKELFVALSWWDWNLSWWEWTWTIVKHTSNPNYNLSSIAGNNKAMFAPTWTEWSSYTIYYKDYVEVMPSHIVYMWYAQYANSALNWIFHMSIYYNNNFSSTKFGSRLMYL